MKVLNVEEHKTINIVIKCLVQNINIFTPGSREKMCCRIVIGL